MQSFKNFLLESLDSPYEFKLKRYGDGMTGSFTNSNGDKVVVAFNAHHIPGAGWAYEISFAIDGDTNLTGKGDEFKTFATIIKIIKTFFDTKAARGAAKEVILAFLIADSPKRAKLYSKIMQRSLVNHPQFKKVDPSQLKPEIEAWCLPLGEPQPTFYWYALEYLMK